MDKILFGGICVVKVGGIVFKVRLWKIWIDMVELREINCRVV